MKAPQIDLIIERKDNIVNLCEIKFYGNTFTQNKEAHRNLLNKQELLEKVMTILCWLQGERMVTESSEIPEEIIENPMVFKKSYERKINTKRVYIIIHQPKIL